MDYLSDTEKAQIEAFLDNKDMNEAVKKALMEGILVQGTTEYGRERNWVTNVPKDMPNDEYGELVKAQTMAMEMIEQAMKKMHQVKSKPSPIQRSNPAR